MTDLITNFLVYFFYNPPREFNYQYIFWIFISLTILLGLAIIIKMRQSKDKILKKLLINYPGQLITAAVLLAINIFSRINRIDILSMRFLTYLLSLRIVYCLYKLAIDLFKRYPQLIHQEPKQESLAKKYHIIKNKRPKHRLR